MTKHYIYSLLVLIFSFNPANSQVSISGSVKRAFGDQFSDVKAKVILSGDLDLSTLTVKKNYSFTDIPIGSFIEIKAVYPDVLLNTVLGLNTLDLIYINNHILGKKKFTTPYQLLAADINQDNKITVADIILLKNLILHKTTSLPGGDPWRYKAVIVVDSDDPTKDIISNSIKFNDIQENKTVNFLGYKLGDLNGDGAVNNQHEVRSNNTYSLKAVNQKFRKGDKIEMLVKASDLSAIQGLQFTMTFDKHYLAFIGVNGEQEEINEDDFSISDRCEGMVSASILTDASYSNDKLCTLTFKAREDGELKYNVYMCSAITPPQAYDNNYEVLDLNLVFDEPAPIVVAESPVLYQNEPNPFFTSTIISLDMPETQEANFSVFNSDGKLIKQINETYSKGKNNVTLNQEDFPASGIYFYQLKTKDFVGTKKKMMIK